MKLSRQQEISFKKIYDKATEDIFDMSYVSILIKKLKKKKWGMFTLCKVFGVFVKIIIKN